MCTTRGIPKSTKLGLIIGACLLSAPVLASELDALKQQVEDLQTRIKEVASKQSEWKQATSVVHLAGYGAVSYIDSEDSTGSFNQVQFAPIFHYQYEDLMMLESELEITVGPEGETETELEYLTLDLFLNDYAVLVAGKFLSPVGQFRQNLHPSWINKLPSAPPGFGHGGAAPVSDTGLQIRGGLPMGGMRGNYALYIANGPELELDGGEVHEILAEGRTRDIDGDKSVGGRFGLLPVPGLEVALSFVTGKAQDQTEVQPPQDYDVIGADFAWQWRDLELRGEYLRAEVAELPSVEGGEWQTWYTQASYKFLPGNFEGVIRYTDFDSPHADDDQKQWALGINYLFAANVIAKLAYESNDGQTGSATDDNRILAQIAYGF
ncbi:MAG: porin [Thiohalophilus sp.]|uniref:porin n=1 Tax=Thiohalophilus sp. TaxID=3028392 RepID=UPI0028706772|nr:porin [Thiohalophilus sp.]MDR9437037.1 porin [Thiohalophilus sp.]